MPSIDLPQLAAFLWFAWVGSVTPGPNIALALAVSAAHGRRAVRPHMAGVALGVTAMLVLCAAGVGAALTARPAAAALLQAAGAAWLAWMGVRMMLAASASASALSPASGDPATVSARRAPARPTVLGSAAFQFSNPKAWMLSLATVSVYADVARPSWLAVALMCAVFAGCAVVALALWSAGGEALGRRLAGNAARRRLLDLALGASLVATAAWVVLR